MRGVPTHVWEATADYGDIGTVRVYYSKPGVALSIHQLTETQVPLRVDIKHKGTGVVEVVSLYHFYAPSDDNSFQANFNVDDCQADAQYVEVVLYRE